MLDQVRQLHRWRQDKVVIDAEIKERREAWELGMADLVTERGMLEIGIADLEAQLKAERVRVYDGIDKSKMWGCAIRDVTKLDYTEDDAFEWAVAHQMALKLDKKGFEKIVKVDTPDFVTITTEPQATIAADLSEYMEPQATIVADQRKYVYIDNDDSDDIDIDYSHEKMG